MLGAFFVSGLCGLVHEIAWTRLLRHVMGNDTFSITTVLCVFMGGLALGSYLGGRIIDRRPDPLRLFAILEGAIAIYCLILPWLINATQPIYELVYQNTENTPSAFYVLSLVRFGCCGLLILVPATFMGATLPILIKFYVRSADRIGGPVGAVYAANTFGAAVGATLAGFVFIPTLGVQKTIWMACLLNGAVAVTGYVLHRVIGPQTMDQGRTKTTGDRLKSSSFASIGAAGHLQYGRQIFTLLLVGYGLSGLASLVYEIAWARVLSLMISSSVYAFSIILGAFIFGLALGSAVCARFVDRVHDLLRALAFVQAAIAVSALMVVPVFERLPFVVAAVVTRFSESFWALQVAEFSLVLLIVLVPTTLMGVSFPLASRLLVQISETLGRSVGTTYGCNTLGNIAGSFLGGFVLIPALGIQRTIFAAVAINAVVSCAWLGMSRGLSTAQKGLSMAVLLIAVGGGMYVLPAWNASVMTLAPYDVVRLLPDEHAKPSVEMERIARSSEVLYHKEGLVTTVTVKQNRKGDLALLTNGRQEATSSEGSWQQNMLAHLPLLLHPQPRHALVIGLASGITLGTAGLYPLEALDCVEISPAVVEAARLFTPYNHGILDDPRVRMIVSDGRNHLALTGTRYDVIISQPSQPSVAGVADLFTQEFFQLCHRRLNAGGVACIWLRTENHDAFRSVIRTFDSVFDTITVWDVSMISNHLLIGTKGPMVLDPQKLAQRMGAAAIEHDLNRIGIRSIPDMFMGLVMDEASARVFAGGAPLHTDDNAMLEFSEPRIMPAQTDWFDLSQSLAAVGEVELSVLGGPEEVSDESLVALRDEVRRAILARRRFVRGWVLQQYGQIDTSIEYFSQALKLKADYEQAHYELGKSLAAAGRLADAIVHLRQVILIRPKDSKAHDKLGAALSILGEHVQAIHHYQTALSIRPDAIDVRKRLGAEFIGQRRFTEAIDHLRHVLRVMPEDVEMHGQLALALGAAGEVDEALRHFEEALRFGAEDPRTLYNFAALLQSRGRVDEAMARLREAIRVDPAYAKAHLMLGGILDREGQTAEALKHLQRAVEFKADWLAPRRQLAWILATHATAEIRNGPRAVELARRAAELTAYQDAGIMDTLAAAYAETSEFERAIQTANEALRLAKASQQDLLVQDIGGRIELYRQAKAFRQVTTPR